MRIDRVLVAFVAVAPDAIEQLLAGDGAVVEPVGIIIVGSCGAEDRRLGVAVAVAADGDWLIESLPSDAPTVAAATHSTTSVAANASVRIFMG